MTAGIVSLPGAHLVGAGTSTNHGTILQPANGLNADLIASSTVGTGTGASPQWWHWGEIANLRIMGNGANQTAGECLKIENMGEIARVHDVELSACYNHNFEIIGVSATQSAISECHVAIARCEARVWRSPTWAAWGCWTESAATATRRR